SSRESSATPKIPRDGRLNLSSEKQKAARPYTPSGQTPYLTPYSTPRHGTQHPSSQSQRVTTAAAAPAPSSVSVPSSFDRHSQSKYNPSGVTSHDPNHWHQAASAWAHRASKPPGSRTPRTPAYEDRGPSTPVAAPAYDDGTPLYDE
ncbi:unnamed protein product, partial [Notodromas monacha]